MCGTYDNTGIVPVEKQDLFLVEAPSLVEPVLQAQVCVDAVGGGPPYLQAQVQVLEHVIVYSYRYLQLQVFANKEFAIESICKGHRASANLS